MSLIKEYSMIVPEEELAEWTTVSRESTVIKVAKALAVLFAAGPGRKKN